MILAGVSSKSSIYTGHMHTPYFPAFRSRLAALGRRTAGTLRQTTLEQLQQHLRDLLPAPLLSATEEGPNSRERVFSLRLTFECFLWQVLKPKTSCREVVRQVQALFRLRGWGWIGEDDSAYTKLDNACRRSAWRKLSTPPLKPLTGVLAPAGSSTGVPSRSPMRPRRRRRTLPKTRNAIRNLPCKSPVAAFRSSNSWCSFPCAVERSSM